MPPSLTEERALHNLGFLRVAGLDEAGRGPLAGPVAASAVILSPSQQEEHEPWLSQIRDSKELSEAQRERVYPYILRRALAVGTGFADSQEIDGLGIVTATKLAMLRAVRSLNLRPDFLLIDAVPLQEARIPFKAIIKGDALCTSIAAASIVAKVTRDRLMRKFDRRYPGYGLAQHKGYPTPSHLAVLARLGPSSIHRATFGPVRELLQRSNRR